MATVLIDVTHTAHCVANSGIQRVVRKLVRHWPTQNTELLLKPIVYDSYRQGWRELDQLEGEYVHFDNDKPPGRKRGASWTLWQRIRGRWSRRLGRKPTDLSGDVCAFVCPELFAGDKRSDSFHRLAQQHMAACPKIAIFYDMIAIDMPGQMPASVVSRYRAYLERLSEFDIIAAISEHSRERLERYWRDMKKDRIPKILALPLGVNSIAGAQTVPTERTGLPLILSVGTLEVRKNHIALLEACQQLWSRGFQFRLRLIGMLNKETGAAAAQKIAELQAAGRMIEWWSEANDNMLAASYEECDFTVYPSIYEGFGLPVLESLTHGRPCICSGETAMAEIVKGGEGCIAIGQPTAKNIAGGVASLLDDRAKIVALSQAALTRRIRTWDDYAAEMCALARDGALSTATS